MILSILLWSGIQLAATISPGPAFAMTVRTATIHGRRSGIALAVGLSLAVGTLMLLVACGLALLIQQSLVLFDILKYAGAAYLAYIGIKALGAKKKSGGELPVAQETVFEKNAVWRSVRRGYVTNILNPKGIVFFTAVFTQFIHTGTPPWLIGIYCLISIVTEASWFSLVTLILTHPMVRARYMAMAHRIERVCGALLVALAVKIFLYRPAAT